MLFLLPGYYLNWRRDVSVTNNKIPALMAKIASSAPKTVFRGHVSEATARTSKTTRPAAVVAAPARR